jgi:hypothetical protein
MEKNLFILLTASILLNAYLIYKLKYQKLKKTETYDAKALMVDLMRGGALVEIRRLDPESIFLRSPRELN